MSKTTHEFNIETDRKVNKPTFHSSVRVYHEQNKTELFQIDVSADSSDVKYMNQTFTFYKPNTTEWRINDTYNVTFEEGVLYSEGASKSPPQDKPTFWNIKVENDKSVSTTKAASTHITDNPTHNKSNTLTTTTQSWTSSKTLVTGEPPISRSAKLGIGLSISFFVMILIAEIAYFKFFYRGGQRNRHD